jgi:transposase-like protein
MLKMRINGKNIMRTPEEKERIVLEYMNGNISTRAIAEKYGTAQGVINKWLKSYRVLGIKGLISNTGKLGQRKGNFKKTEIEQLKHELLKKEIELMRLKKGYLVKGVGAKKEYVSISDLNMK